MTHGERRIGHLWERLQDRRQRAFYLRWVLFTGLFLDVILGLLWQTLKFNLSGVFILVGCRNTTIELIWPAYQNLDMASCLVFILTQIQSIVCVRSVLRKFWGRAALLIFGKCRPAFISMVFFFLSCFSELQQPSLDHCFLCYIQVHRNWSLDCSLLILSGPQVPGPADKIHSGWLKSQQCSIKKDYQNSDLRS